ncbi:microtubule-associated protein futsch isoform X2 [Pseudomyrmex gracilis]|nr:microtubule-associated protein futsch isoform X2 [Pseudomyrmex gracilis]XP_020295974.1 microtubule-associated protein futsch isoform X2 [Pseudomyrmex gracilis]
MSTTDPTGEGGGGGGGSGGEEGATPTNVEQSASSNTGGNVQVQATTQQQQQQQQQQHPPPSPLSGCYLLVVLPEPHTAQHKDLILNRLAKGFLSWDKDSCHVDLEKELLALVAQAPEGEEARNGERLIQYATENLVTEVLIHPQTNTLLQCIRNLLASFTKHRHIIHAGYTFGGNGSWILQDGTFSLADFLDAFSEHEVQRVLRAYENSVTVDIHCAGVGDWTTNRLSKEICCRSCRVRVNPDDVLTAGVPAITSFTNYIGQYLVPQTLDQLMEPSDVVGNIRFSHPTLYVFPGGQGDAALFGINGFNMLVDGGFARKACFWDFTRHLDRLDAVLVTRINNSNIGGMFSVLRKKKEMHVYPQIGHFFCNLVERRQSNSPDGDKDIDPLIVNLVDIGQEMVLNLRHINLRAHPCYRDPDPINLYHKVGHGTLDMYVLSPNKDSREVREFLAKWHASDSKLFAGSHKKDSNNLTFPIQNLVSICALLVWQPANPEDNITRILFPGSTPQHKIFEGFDRLKHLDFLKHPVCSAKTLSPSVSLATLRDKPAKQKPFIEKEPKRISEPKKEKREPSESKAVPVKAAEDVPKITPQSTPIIPPSKPKAEIKTKKVAENKKIETEAKESKKIELEKESKKVEPEAKESKKIEKELKEVKKEPKKESIKTEKPEKRDEDVKKIDLIKQESDKSASKEPKEPKPKIEPKKKEPKDSKSVKAEIKKSEAITKPKLSEKKVKPSGAEKKDVMKSSPTTPKKIVNGTVAKTEISKTVPKAKPATKVVSSLPAKSAKEANNRKVVEQKKSEVEKSTVKETAAAPVVKVSAKPKPMDRKPISRRTKPVSPSKARMPGSPAKSTRSTPTTSVKSDKDGVIRKVKGDKGTTDSSTVSTPSGIEAEVIKPIDKSLIEQSEDISLDSIESKVLADLKEEREVVEEIEAVLQKAEIEETRKSDRFEGDDEITAEATDKKEEDITEEDVTAEIEDIPKKESSRKESQELTEEDEYLIVEKEEVYTEDSAQSGEGEQKHVLDEAESEKAKILKDMEAMKEKGEKEEPEKEKDKSPEKKVEQIVDKDEKESAELPPEHKKQLQEEVKEIIASATEIVQKAEEKDDSGKKDSEEITKEPSSLSPDKLDSSEKKTTDTDIKPDVDQKEHILEKMEESQERISTIESGATTTAPTLPEDERIPLDGIKEDIDEKHVIEEVKEKDAPVKMKEEVIPEAISTVVKPEVKVFDVRQAMQSLQRDIVKTPDEVADLPVHEEVDPKLYRMEDFEKGKEEKPSPSPQEIKEPPTPPVKEQKGVFSFFGKVADKFEKGIDKLTKKTKKETDKDSDDKSSSKSSSPKETKVLEKTVLEEVDVEKMFPKVGKHIDKPEVFEEVKPTVAHVKVAAIKETAAFIQEEIDAHRQSVPNIEEKVPIDKLEEIKKAEVKVEEALLAKDISPAPVSLTKPIEDKDIEKEIELLKEEGEEAEEVKALLEEISNKFKTVKDSLRDSLESLEEKIKEEELTTEMQPSVLKDAVKDTLEGVAEKLEEIKPHIETLPPEMIKEPEKVKFDIPKDEEFEEEYEEEPEESYRDVKEAVRDIGDVLAGTAGIDLEAPREKPKDVMEIVKKVAEVLKDDDFLSEETLVDQASKEEEKPSVSTDRKPSKEDILSISSERKLSVPSEKISPEKITEVEEEKSKPTHEEIVIPKKVGITEEIPVHEEIEEFIEEPHKSLAPQEKPEIKEEPCVKVVTKKDDLSSPKKDVAKDKIDAQKICEEMLHDDQHVCDQHKKPADIDTSQTDVLEAGIESICVKKVAKRPSFEEQLVEAEIEQPVIGFEQKVSPAKAEIVMVTPGSTPTSPKFTDKLHGQELDVGSQELPKLPEEVKQILTKEVPVEKIIEELIITKKKKITIEVIEYITIVKRIPKERVVYIIEEIIVKKGLRKESVVDDPEILKLKESITPEKRMEIEEYIVNEYIVKGKRITIEVVEEISIKKVVPKTIVIEIIEEIIVKRKIARHMVLDVPEEVLSQIIKEELPEEELPEVSEAEDQVTSKVDITAKRESITKVSSPTEISEMLKKTPEDEKEKEIPKVEDEKRKSVAEVPSAEILKTQELVTPEKRKEVEEYIVNEYVTKGNSINIQKLEEICGKKEVPKRIIIEIIEEIIIKRKMPRHVVISLTEEELSRAIKEEAISESEVTVEKRKSIAEVPSSIEEKESPLQLKKDKKEAISDQEIAEELSVEEEDIEEEVDGFVSIPRRISDEKVDAKKKISPVKGDVSPIAAKEHEKDVLDDFEAVEQEYKVRDVPVTSPEKADEIREKEDVEEAVEDTTSDVIEADEKFVQETKEKIGKEELQPDTAKDFKPDKKRELEELETSEVSEIVDTTEKYLDEAKEKTDDSILKQTVTKPSVSLVSDKAEEPLSEKADELKEAEEKKISEDVIEKRASIDAAAIPEAKSKTISPVSDKSEKPLSEEADESKEAEEKKIPDVIIDKRPSVDAAAIPEAKSKTVSPVSDEPEKPLSEKADELKEAEEKKIPEVIIDKRPSVDAAAIPEAKSTAPSTEKVDEKAVTDETKKIEPMIKEKVEEPQLIEKVPEKVSKEIKSETKLADATGFSFEPKTDLHEDDKKFKQLDTTEIKETPVVKEEETPEEIPEEAARRKRSILKDAEDEIVQTKDEIEKPKIEKLTDEPVKDDTSTVKRMLVTASSEDGREETEICATGTITFTKTVTPDDSLKDVSIKSTPDKDSLLLEITVKSTQDKDSSHSSMSTPRDSISDKSAPEGKDKITSEDSLDKSPVGTRDSQDLEDSLEKSDFRKSKDAEILSIDDDKEKVPEKSEEAVKPKSPIEKEDSKAPVVVDKDKSPESPKSPVEKVEKPKSPLSCEQTMKTDEIVSTKTIDTLLEEKSPLDVIPEDTQKSKSSIHLPAEKVLVESAEKPKLPIEMLSEKEGTDVSKTPESLHSEDVSPAETIFSKSPTDKPEMYIAKTPIDEEDVALEAVAEKSPVKEAKSITDKDIPISTEKEKAPSPEKDDQRPEKLDAKDISPKPTSPIVATSALDEKGLDTALIEKSRSPSISSEKEISVRSKSPSIADDKSMQADHLLAHPDEESLNIVVNVKVDLKLTELEDKDASKSSSPSIATDKLPEEVVEDKRPSIVEKEIIEQLVEPKSSIVSDKEEKEDAIDKSRSSSIGELVDKDVSERRKSSITTTKVEEEKSVEKSRSPSITEEKQTEKITDAKLIPKEIDEKPKETKEEVKQPEKLDEKEPVDKSRSASLVGEKSDDIKSLDKSPPSDKAEEKETEKTTLPILESVHDEKGPIDKARSPSAISDKSDEEKEADRSKSPSLGEDKLDRQDVTEHYLEKPKSPIFDRPQSPKVIDKTEEPHDKDRSPSVVSDKSDSKKVSDRSRSPSISVEKVDLKDMDLSVERTRSPSIKDDKLEQLPVSKSPTALQFAEQPVDKSRSSSVVSISGDQKDSAGKSLSITDDKSDLKGDTEQLSEKLKSSDQKEEPADRSKSPSVSGEKPDLKDVTEPPTEKSRSASVISVSGDQKEHFDRSKSPSIAGEKLDLKDVAEQLDEKSRSPSVVSVSTDQKEQFDRSKSPSVAGEKPDLKDVAEQPDEKSRSPSVVSISADQKEQSDHSKSPSVAGEKPDLKDVAEQPDKKSPSASDLKEPGDQSKSPSIAEEKPTEKDTLEARTEKSRSSSVVSIGEQKEIDRSKSPSVISETPDLKDVADQQVEKSKKTTDEQKTPGIQQEPIDRSKSPSASEKLDDKKSTDDSKSSSLSGDKSDLTDITEEPLDKSKSPSITSIASDRKESIDKVKLLTVLDKKEEVDKSLSPSVASDQSEEAKSAVSSKPASVAGDTVDLKDVSEIPIDKSRSPSVISTSDQKEPIEKPTSPTAPHKIEEPHDRSKSPSVASEKSDEKKSVDGSRATSVTEEKPDLKDVIESPADKSRKSSAVSITTEKAEPFEKSISPTVSDQLEPLGDRSKFSISPSDKSDEKDDKTSTKDFYEDAIDKSPSFTDMKMPDKKHAEEESSTASKDLDIKQDDTVLSSHDKSRSPSIVLDKPDDKTSLEKVDIDGLKTSAVTEELAVTDKTRSLSIISDKTEPKSPSEVSRSPSLIDDKIDLKDKSRSSSIASGKLDDIDKVSLQEAKTTERSLSSSLQAGQIPASESAKSEASSPVDKVPKDRSRSQSVFDVGEKIPARTSSLFEDKPTEKAISPEEKDTSEHTGEPLDEQEEHKSPTKSPVTSVETIEKEMQKIREKRFAEFEEPHAVQSSKVEKSYDVEEDIVKITAEKKADIEKYILEEFIVKKKKINSIIIEKLVMTYVVPQFIVMEIIEDLISRENVSRNAVFDFTDEELSKHEKESKETVTTEKRADVEKYINEEYIAKKKKITPVVLEEIVILKAVPRYILITIIEEIIVKKQISRNTIIEGDLEARAKSPDEIKEQSSIPTSVDLKRSSITPEYPQSHEKESDTTKDESSDGKVSPAGSDRYSKDAPSASPSLSPEPVPSDKSTRGSPPLWEQYKHDEFTMKEKKIEIENLLEKTVEKCISKKEKITQEMIREIIDSAFPLSRYIIFEILNNILIKLKISKESVLDEEVILLDRYEAREDVRGIHRDDYDGNRYDYDNDYDDLEHDARKSSMGVDMYAESSERQDKSVTDYPMDYESQFHKAFVSGMTEMRTTHITTLSGKSTPEYADGASGKLPEHTLTTTHITKTDIDDLKTAQPMQTVILRESKIAEPHLPEESAKDDDKVTETIKRDVVDTKETAEISTGESSKEKPESQTVEKEATSEKSDSTAESTGEVIVIKKIVKREVIEGEEPEKVTKVVQEIVEDAPETITKIIKRETVEPDDKPEVVTKVIKREIIEQDEPEVITKVIRREIIVPDEEPGDSKEDSGEFVKTITTKTTRTIVTEELPDAELLQTDPSKIYTDPTSGATYRVVSDEGASDTTSSADVKRIVTTVTTITGPDGKITTKKDVKESTDTVDSEEMLEKLIDSSKITTETTKSAEKIIKETITTATSGTSTPDVKTFYDSGKSTPDLKEDKFDSTGKDRLGAEKFEPPVSPLVRDIISDDKSYSGKSSPDISLPKDIVFSGSTGKSTPEIPMSPLIRDGAAVQPQVSGRSTPDIRSEGRLSSTPEGLKSGEMIRTIITTTKTISDEGEIVTTTREVTETTNEKGETVILAEKTDVKVDERLSSKDAESAISDIIGSIKSSEMQRTGSAASDDAASEKDRSSPLSEQSSARSKAPHTLGSSEERHTYSDDEPPSSPLSSTSQVGYSPQATRRLDPGSDKEEEQKQVEFSTAAMSSSFYGELPAVPPQMSAMKTFHEETGIQQKSSDPIPIHSRFTVEKEFVGYGEKPDAKKYVDEADLDFDKALMEHKEMKEASDALSSGISPRYTNGSLRHESSDSKDHPSSSFRDDTKDDSKGDSKKDPLEGWGTPLGLPSPKPPRKFNLKNSAQSQPSCSSESTSDTLNFDVAKEWGEPLRLPSPAPVTNEISNKGTPGTPKKERKQAKKVQSENIKNKKRSESPSKNEKKIKDSKNKIQPVYMDLAYVPHHGNSYYTSLDFFKRVRARYYVFSGTEPSREVYDALLEAKKTWEDKDLEVTMIPTYDTDTLGYWVADNEEALAANHIDLSPSASRCTINLQDHETSCSAYRLEF